jgi:hypothetical protein
MQGDRAKPYPLILLQNPWIRNPENPVENRAWGGALRKQPKGLF